MNQSDILQGDSGRNQADIQNEQLEIKRSLVSILLALLPLGLTAILMVFEGSIPGLTLGENDYAITQYLAFLVIGLTMGGLVFWQSYLGQFWGIAWISVLGLVPLLASQNMAIDAWNRCDDSAPIVRRVTVINQVGRSYQTRNSGTMGVRPQLGLIFRPSCVFRGKSRGKISFSERSSPTSRADRVKPQYPEQNLARSCQILD